MEWFIFYFIILFWHSALQTSNHNSANLNDRNETYQMNCAVDGHECMYDKDILWADDDGWWRCANPSIIFFLSQALNMIVLHTMATGSCCLQADKTHTHTHRQKTEETRTSTRPLWKYLFALWKTNVSAFHLQNCMVMKNDERNRHKHILHFEWEWRWRNVRWIAIYSNVENVANWNRIGLAIYSFLYECHIIILYIILGICLECLVWLNIWNER